MTTTTAPADFLADLLADVAPAPAPVDHGAIATARARRAVAAIVAARDVLDRHRVSTRHDERAILLAAEDVRLAGPAGRAYDALGAIADAAGRLDRLADRLTGVRASGRTITVTGPGHPDGDLVRNLSLNLAAIATDRPDSDLYPVA